MDLNIRIAGAAGQGVETMGELLTDSFALLGVHVFTTQTYMSRIRGGLNWFDIRIADRELFSGREEVDLLVALTPQADALLRKDLVESGVVLFNGPARAGAIPIEFEQEAQRLGGKVMANAVAAGAVFAVLGYPLDALEQRLEAVFLEKKGREVVEANVVCARRGAELARPHGARLEAPPSAGAPAFALAGNEAVGYGLAAAGVKFVSCYPMTPSTGIFQFLAAKQHEYGMVVEQAEDEIAAINMVIGAAYAGAPAVVATSGGGFALMVEGVSLAGMLELPALVVLGQRPGPATGLPTRTAQQDLRFALHAGHGEFPKALYAPGTVEQAVHLARRALETAHSYQTPVIMLTDQFLADIRKNVGGLDFSPRPIDRHLEENPAEDYLRYAFTDSGVSPRALPGSRAFVVMDSDEHTEDGHITDNVEARVRMQGKRMRKLQGMTEEFLQPERYGPVDAVEILVCWGSTYGPCREAVDRLNEAGRAVAMVHFPQLWPINVPVARQAIGEAARVVCVECNQTAQFAGLLRETGVLGAHEFIGKYNGVPFTGGEIARRFAALAGQPGHPEHQAL
jgi:2-oxoglutarate ferredoxin oxidoreductase subunit alpha